MSPTPHTPGPLALGLRAAIIVLAGPLLVSAPLQAATPGRLEARVQKIEDTQEIHDLLIRYGLLLDGKDFKAYAELFAKDGVWIGGFGTYVGREAITAMLEKYLGPAAPGTRNTNNFHLLTNEVIEVDGNRARSVSKMIFFVKGSDGRPVPQMAGHYDDTFVREDGRWRFLRRVAQGDVPFSDPLAPPKPAD